MISISRAFLEFAALGYRVRLHSALVGTQIYRGLYAPATTNLEQWIHFCVRVMHFSVVAGCRVIVYLVVQFLRTAAVDRGSSCFHAVRWLLATGSHVFDAHLGVGVAVNFLAHMSRLQSASFLCMVFQHIARNVAVHMPS